MSRHQLYRNYDYENDIDEYDGDGDGGEDEMSPEDREIMRDATAAVRTVLGDKADKVTETQIQEALWHYYYDVDKSAGYLTKKFIDSPVETKTPLKKETNDGSRTRPQYPVLSPTRADRASIAASFYDMPWMSVPQCRQTLFVPPVLPRGGLLGGSSAPPKMSKLQALAAQRKRKAEEAKKAKESGGSVGDDKTDVDVRELRSKTAKLALNDAPQGSLRGAQWDTSAIVATPSSAEPQTSPVVEDLQKEDTIKEAETLSQYSQSSSGTGAKEEAREVEPPLIAQPSAFAQALFGPKKHKPLKVSEYSLLAVPSLSRAPPSTTDAFLEPSPDDVVLQAQAKAFKQASGSSTPARKKGSAIPGSGAKSVASLTDSVKKLKVDFTPLPKSKNLNVLSEYAKTDKKKNANFVVVGHVDAGKSTMMARLLLDMKVVDQRTVDKYQKEAQTIGKSSFALAWVLDSGADERTHGVTIDIATRHFETEKMAFTILDAPGHRDFIPNMIAGASQADFAILVVDAKTGAFESGIKGQTREHALLLRSMGVSRIIVAVNKLDTVGWSQARFDEIVNQVRGFLSVTGFKLSNISFVPVAGLLGDNLLNRSTAPAASWYTGGTLVEELERSEPMPRALEKPLRLPVSEVFKTAGSAISVAGRIEAGSLQVGDALLVVPGNVKAHVKALMRDGQPAGWAVAGHNVVIHLANIDPLNVYPGVVFCDPGKPAPCIDIFTMKALAFDPLFPMPVEVHRGRLNEAGVIRELSAVLHKVTGKVLEKTPLVVKPGNVARIRVKLNKKIPLESGQRVVLRAEGQTIAAGLLE